MGNTVRRRTFSSQNSRSALDSSKRKRIAVGPLNRAAWILSIVVGPQVAKSEVQALRSEYGIIRARYEKLDRILLRLTQTGDLC
jgi:hypothetical protein